MISTSSPLCETASDFAPPASKKRGALSLRLASFFSDESAGLLTPERLEVLAQSVDPLETDPEFRTPLMLAAAADAPACLLRLLPCSEVLATDLFGQDALMHAAACGHLRCVEALLPHSDPTATDQSGQSALLLAAGHGHPEVVKALLVHSSARLVADNGDSALTLAAKSGSSKCVAQLVPHSDLDHTNATRRTALQSAAALGHVSIVRLLIEAHPQEQWSDQSLSALRLAALWRRESILRLLPLYWNDEVFRTHPNVFKDALLGAANSGASANQCVGMLLQMTPHWPSALIDHALSHALDRQAWDCAETLLPHANAQLALDQLDCLPAPRRPLWLSVCENALLKEVLTLPECSSTTDPTVLRPSNLNEADEPALALPLAPRVKRL